MRIITKVSGKIEGLSDKTLKLYHMYLDDFFISTDKKLEDVNANDIRIYLHPVREERGISNREKSSQICSVIFQNK